MKTLSNFESCKRREIFYRKGFDFDGYQQDHCVIYRTKQGCIVVDPGIRNHNEFSEKIVATIITHGHLDHWVGLSKIKEGLIFMDHFVSELISFLGEENLSFNRVRYINAKDCPIFIRGVPVRIDVFNLFHSIPYTKGLVLESKDIRVVHLGDFKFNTLTSFTKASLMRELYQISRKPVDYLVMTIFEADKEGFTSPEDPVLDNITEIIRKSSGRVIIVSFATNINRIKQLVYRAKMIRRLVGFEGPEMSFAQRAIGFIDTKDWHPKDVIFTVGCQGENGTLLDLDNNPSFYLRKSDVLIFSSQCVEGKEERLRHLCERLQGFVGRIIVNKGEVNRIGLGNIKNIEESFVHVSGYEKLEGLRLVLEILKPKKVLCWPQTFPQNYFFSNVCQELGIEVIDESNRVIEL